MFRLELKYIEYDENLSPRGRRELEHAVAYSLLNDMLLRHFGIENPSILKNENGKPYVENGGVHFSLSHTAGLAVCVVADTPVGVDCEKITPKSDTDMQKFANRFFVENEIKMLNESKNATIDFYKIWTGKEAVIKKRGSNMSDLKKIDVTQENLQVFSENGYIISINI